MYSHLHTLGCPALLPLSHEIALSLVMCPDIRVDRHSGSLIAGPDPSPCSLPSPIVFHLLIVCM